MKGGLIALSVILLIVGILLIVKGSDIFVNAAIKISRALGVGDFIIGATVVSIGTTIPELVTSITAVAMEMINGGGGYMPIAIGNSIGSMCCNIALIMALVAVIKPIKFDKNLSGKAIILVLTSVFVTVCIAFGTLEIWQGVIFIVIFIAFIAENFRSGKKMMKLKSLEMPIVLTRREKVITGLLFVIGALTVTGGAYLTVDNIERLCVAMNIPTQIIGATVVAVGTSLPELATSLTALRKGNGELGLGNVIGANIINGTLLLGIITFMSGGISIDPYTANVGIYFMLAIAIIGIIPTILRGKVTRWHGLLLLGVYAAMIGVNVAAIV